MLDNAPSYHCSCLNGLIDTNTTHHGHAGANHQGQKFLGASHLSCCQWWCNRSGSQVGEPHDGINFVSSSCLSEGGGEDMTGTGLCWKMWEKSQATLYDAVKCQSLCGCALTLTTLTSLMVMTAKFHGMQMQIHREPARLALTHFSPGSCPC